MGLKALPSQCITIYSEEFIMDDIDRMRKSGLKPADCCLNCLHGECEGSHPDWVVPVVHCDIMEDGVPATWVCDDYED